MHFIVVVFGMFTERERTGDGRKWGKDFFFLSIFVMVYLGSQEMAGAREDRRKHVGDGFLHFFLHF